MPRANVVLAPSSANLEEPHKTATLRMDGLHHLLRHVLTVLYFMSLHLCEFVLSVCNFAQHTPHAAGAQCCEIKSVQLLLFQGISHRWASHFSLFLCFLVRVDVISFYFIYLCTYLFIYF